ncbi:hypothetical protein GP486_004425 [Trichoglossum hirsutum]|uniref:PNPLA domain-containing protein n=1 Tax=Trichoglossum hirsutum TaxID=265104 RepID=A0A9P8RP34_9PEZI|nr:hypothetical protein GP486_004425 [Trichoglossum hirsutum]
MRRASAWGRGFTGCDGARDSASVVVAKTFTHRIGEALVDASACAGRTDLFVIDAMWSSVIGVGIDMISTESLPTDIRVDDLVKSTLKSTRTLDEQMELHLEGENTAWFGVVRNGIEKPKLRDYGRFGDLVKELSRGCRRRFYPGLVSFVGETGAGKSALIKLLIEFKQLYSHCEQKQQTPVVGTQYESCPTSGDVHLYADPTTFEGDFPIFYADSEGLEGGEMLPMSERLRGAVGADRAGGRAKKAHYSSERPITWATTGDKQSRQYAVANLYPRLFYTFSDVVVFVLDNPRQFEKVVKQLLDWAAIGLEKSSNQPVLPHAIIVLNASEVELPNKYWDVEEEKRRLFGEYANVTQTPTFKPYVEFWGDRRERICSLKELLRKYYSSVTVIRIPRPERPTLVSKQINTLYKVIDEACQKSRKIKQSRRMLFTADELYPYLQSAFDHFAGNLDDPFDFVQVSFINSPISLDFGDNILKLAVNAIAANAEGVLKNKLSAQEILEELSFMVASCIMLDEARQSTHGKLEIVMIIPAALRSTYSDQERTCRRNLSEIFRAFHTFRDKIYNRLQQLLANITHDTNGGIPLEEQTAPKVHQEAILRPFYKHLGGAHKYLSHSTCFSCLMTTPEHPLRCRHVLCTPCARAYGKPRGEHLIEVTECPLEAGFRAYATATVPTIFENFRHAPSNQTYQGGGLRYNNPIEIADAEYKCIWPEREDCLPDIALSVGFGFDPKTSRSTRRLSGTTRLKDFFSNSKSIGLLDPVRSSLECERVWKHYLTRLRLKYPDYERYVRLSPELGSPPPKLDEVEQIKGLREEIVSLSGSLPIERLAQQLIATCFYFETNSDEVCDDGIIYTGSIQCRFVGKNLQNLGKHIQRNMNRGYPCFAIRERQDRDAEKLYVDKKIVSKMILQSQFNIDPAKVKVSEKAAIVEILMHFGKTKSEQSFPISGFPRSLRGDMRGSQYGVSKKRYSVSDMPQEEWKGPSSSQPSNTLSRYMSPDYVAEEFYVAREFPTELAGRPVTRDEVELAGSPVDGPQERMARKLGGQRQVHPRHRSRSPTTGPSNQRQSNLAPASHGQRTIPLRRLDQQPDYRDPVPTNQDTYFGRPNSNSGSILGSSSVSRRKASDPRQRWDMLEVGTELGEDGNERGELASIADLTQSRQRTNHCKSMGVPGRFTGQ